MFTYNGLIEQIKQQDQGLVGIQLPMLSMHFIEFSNEAGLSYEEYPTIEKYISAASYQEKRDVFESLGFKVLFMSLSTIKVMHYAQGRTNGAPVNPTIDEAFINNKRNVFLLDVSVGMKNLYFVIEYQDNDALANYTIDREKLARDQERQEKMRALFGRNKK